MNQRGFFVYKSWLTAYKIDTKPLLIIPFAIIKEIKWVEIENSTKRKKYEDKRDHLYSFQIFLKDEFDILGVNLEETLKKQPFEMWKSI